MGVPEAFATDRHGLSLTLTVFQGGALEEDDVDRMFEVPAYIRQSLPRSPESWDRK